jgi:nucleoside-diphosphate-sugar epimerase
MIFTVFYLVACELAFEGNSFDYVLNCACETKTGQTDPVYKEGIYKVSVNCANAAANHNVKRFVEISSGTMFSSEKVKSCSIFTVIYFRFFF